MENLDQGIGITGFCSSLENKKISDRKMPCQRVQDLYTVVLEIF